MLKDIHEGKSRRHQAQLASMTRESKKDVSEKHMYTLNLQPCITSNCCPGRSAGWNPRVHVGIRYVLRAERGSHILVAGGRYILHARTAYFLQLMCLGRKEVPIWILQGLRM